MRASSDRAAPSRSSPSSAPTKCANAAANRGQSSATSGIGSPPVLRSRASRADTQCRSGAVAEPSTSCDLGRDEATRLVELGRPEMIGLVHHQNVRTRPLRKDPEQLASSAESGSSAESTTIAPSASSNDSTTNLGVVQVNRPQTRRIDQHHPRSKHRAPAPEPRLARRHARCRDCPPRSRSQPARRDRCRSSHRRTPRRCALVTVDHFGHHRRERQHTRREDLDPQQRIHQRRLAPLELPHHHHMEATLGQTLRDPLRRAARAESSDARRLRQLSSKLL